MLEDRLSRFHVVSNPPPARNFLRLQPVEQHQEVIVKLYDQGYCQNKKTNEQYIELLRKQYNKEKLKRQDQQQKLKQLRLQQEQHLNLQDHFYHITKRMNLNQLLRYFNPKEVSNKPPENFMEGDGDGDFDDGDSMNAKLSIPLLIQSLEQDLEQDTETSIGTLHAEMHLSYLDESSTDDDDQQIHRNMIPIEEHFNMKQAQQTWCHATVAPAIETEQCIIDANILYIPFYYDQLQPISLIQVNDPAEEANSLPPDNDITLVERPSEPQAEADPTPSTGAFSSIFKNMSQHQNNYLPPKELEITSDSPISIHTENEKHGIFPSPSSQLNKYITNNETCITEKKKEKSADKVTKKKKIANPGPSSSKNSDCSTRKKIPSDELTIEKTKTDIKINTNSRPLSWLDKYISKDPCCSTGTKRKLPAINDTPPASPSPYNWTFNSNIDPVNNSAVIEHDNPLDTFETEIFDNSSIKLNSNEQMPSDNNKLSSNQTVDFEQASSVANDLPTSELQLYDGGHQVAWPPVVPIISLVESSAEHTQGRTSAHGTQAYRNLYETVPKKRYRKAVIVTTPGPVTRSKTRRMRSD